MQGPWCSWLQEGLGDGTPSTLGRASFPNGRVRIHIIHILIPHGRRLAWSPPRARAQRACPDAPRTRPLPLLCLSLNPEPRFRPGRRRSPEPGIKWHSRAFFPSCGRRERGPSWAAASQSARPPARQRKVVNPEPPAAARSASSSLLHSPERPRILRLPAPLRRPPWRKVSLLIYQIFSGCLKIRTLPGGCFFWTTQSPAYIVTIFF